jgi:hypothetical protein
MWSVVCKSVFILTLHLVIYMPIAFHSQYHRVLLLLSVLLIRISLDKTGPLRVKDS